jgi:hypothetical protein
VIAYNVDWERWCKSSILQHFDNGKGDTEIYVEGFPRATDTLADYLELRVDGPYTRENANDQWRLYFEVNLLVVVKINPEADAFRINRLTGRVSGLFTTIIEVKKYGNGVGDDGSLIGCLSLVPRNGERIQTSHFGKIRPDTDILQASVEGHYHIYFD